MATPAANIATVAIATTVHPRRELGWPCISFLSPWASSICGHFRDIGEYSVGHNVATPYGDLLGAKYARAIDALEPAKTKVQLTDLSFAIFDELISGDQLKKRKLIDIIRYRKASEKAREEFLEHLSVIQRKQASIGIDGDYAGAIQKLVTQEIRPAVQTFKNRLQTIDESLFGAIAKGVIGAAGGSSVVTLFGDLSWQKIIALAGVGAAYVAQATIDAFLAERTARRECSVSYILSLDE